jgi:hypothetical protein
MDEYDNALEDLFGKTARFFDRTDAKNPEGIGGVSSQMIFDLQEFRGGKG